ncbi:selenophosphate synthase [Thermosporothrix hazakensis]|uniref:Selenide, water dikinase n=3 Tax=Thermosporothrix TaxID=768650 RepID=A0A326UAN2_THEHA|nr:selenophosphate synthase [Thermosporothrix hazakensis]BBH91058.1 selenide, water dikinase [Thermosporothrix sp. COM3]GCE49111.1 selenide, water dikinase [Thermosporothrix hazakensis]
MGPGALAQVLRPLTHMSAPPELLVGLHSIDDAAVYRVNEHQAVISTADFFPPVVDDPYAFGAIAAANALSDIYAMGGQVLMALNLVAWPDNLDAAILTEILRGGSDIVAQAGAVIAGGHTVTDREPKYGLSVTGTVHPDHILTKGGARSGDLLILSKPLGTGLITTAHKRDQVQEADLHAAIQSMMQLNRRASEALVAAGNAVHAVTDITGFGLLGHAWEMAVQSKVTMRFSVDALPLLPGALHYVELGCIPGGAGRNEEYLAQRVRFAANVSEDQRILFWDPQTSGGLFAAIDPEVWPKLAAIAPDVTFWRIGEVGEQVDNEAQVLLEVK